MKKQLLRWMLLCCLIAVGFIGYQKSRKSWISEEKQLRKETTLSYFNQKKLNEKLAGSDPEWMKQQLDEDFAPFEKRKIGSKQVDQTFQTLRKNHPHPYWVRYRILDRRLYRFFSEGDPISTCDNNVELALKAMIHLKRVKDIDLIVSFEDGLPLSSMPKGFYLTQDPSDQAPVFISAKQKDAPYVILIPDWRSIAGWWAANIEEIRSRYDDIPWQDKINSAVWRGSFTRDIRLTLCRISRQHPTLLDAKLNIKADDPKEQAQWEKEGLFGGRLEWDDLLKHKFLPIVDGVMCAAPALQWRLLSKCLTLKQESDEIQWFYKGIQPYVHYVPIQNDLSDLPKQIEWAKDHDKECEQISKNGYQFANANLMMEDVYHYFSRVLDRYGKIQEIDRARAIFELKNDPRWVDIQSRKQLKRYLSSSQRPVFHGPTPY